MAAHIETGPLATPHPYSRALLKHLGLVAGMCDELGLGESESSVLQLVCEHQAGIPLLMEALRGINSDKASFRDTVKTHIGQMGMVQKRWA